MNLPTTSIYRSWPLLLALAGLVLVGCSYPNSHGRQGLPHAWRLVTVPAEARATFPEHGNLQYVTPADIDGKFKLDDVVVIEKEGYERFEGTLGDLAQIASGTWEYRLTPIDR